MSEPRDPFPAYYEALESRHRAELTFAEVRRALQALSSLYVERRDGIALGKALEGRGKRAAFALYYSWISAAAPAARARRGRSRGVRRPA